MARAVKRQRTIVGKLIREVRGKLAVGAINPSVSPFTLSSLTTLLERADRIRTQKRTDKNKLYALHAPEVECISKGKARNRYESMTKLERKRLKRRQAVEPVIGHVKHDHRMIRCHLIGSLGDALHAIACAAGYNIRWLMRAMLRLGLKGLFAPLNLWPWVMLAVRWSAIGEITRRSITAKASPARKRHFPFVGAIAI